MARVGDSVDLAQKIAWLAAHENERRRMGESSRRRYEQRFGESQFVANMTAVLLAAGVDNAARQVSAADRETATSAYFDRVATQFQGNYAERDSFKERHSVWERSIRESLPRLAPDGLCLDVGCGDGRLGQVAAAAGVRTIGMDQSAEMLQLAAARARAHSLEARTEYLQTQLPLAASQLEQYRGRASLILCSSVLEYIDDFEQVLRQFHALLRANGRLIVSVPNGRSLYRWAERLLGGLRTDPDSYLKYQRHVFDPRAFRSCVERLGYSVIHDEYFARPIRALQRSSLARRCDTSIATLYLLVAEKL